MLSLFGSVSSADAGYWHITGDAAGLYSGQCNHRTKEEVEIYLVNSLLYSAYLTVAKQIRLF